MLNFNQLFSISEESQKRKIKLKLLQEKFKFNPTKKKTFP